MGANGPLLLQGICASIAALAAPDLHGICASRAALESDGTDGTGAAAGAGGLAAMNPCFGRTTCGALGGTGLACGLGATGEAIGTGGDEARACS